MTVCSSIIVGKCLKKYCCRRGLVVGSPLLPQIHARQETCRWWFSKQPPTSQVRTRGSAGRNKPLSAANTTQYHPPDTLYHTFHHKPTILWSGTWIVAFSSSVRFNFKVNSTICFLIQIRTLVLSSVWGSKQTKSVCIWQCSPNTCLIDEQQGSTN
jgi:hypothetical protein